MYKIVPTAQLVFQIVNDKLSKQQSKKLILLSIIKQVLLAYLVAVVFGTILYFAFGTPESQPAFIASFFFLLPLMIIGSIYYMIKKYTLSMGLYDFTVKYFDKSINDVANAFDTFTSGYLIDFLCLETDLYDSQTVEIKDHNSINYGELRKSVLKVYNKNKSPKIPFRTKEYKNYMNLLIHVLKNPLDEITFREMYLRSKQ
ncbi:hypothetical protein AMD27_16355 (plasmid) [Acinetobacter sp. TGL-Y2]|uniref:hypothetical protein n=1 Tax=Acinetobacter sp. TGL-Y2 TaxID=1407071 RepID=UPI0007A675DF|nr:hypothetical protein [Acinetobacter sp. TGL-Y2]AMW80489.1 hypothetical protein AMD27_16355 [Acinetobacter sp. TGL-Y2]